jgi:hypothetical protein
MHLKGTFKTMYVIFLVDLLLENWWICFGITRYLSSIDEIHILDNKITSARSMWAIGGHPPVHQPIPFRTVIENCNNHLGTTYQIIKELLMKQVISKQHSILSSQESFKNSIQYHPISWCNSKFLWSKFPPKPNHQKNTIPIKPTTSSSQILELGDAVSHRTPLKSELTLCVFNIVPKLILKETLENQC